MREAAMRGEEPPDFLPDLPETSISTQPPAPSSSSQDSYKGAIYLIDFGLTTASIADEDKAVDLYVLERAFAATHPAAEPLLQEVLKAYGEGGKGAKGVLKRLSDVRLRGRKRSMLGWWKGDGKGVYQYPETSYAYLKKTARIFLCELGTAWQRSQPPKPAPGVEFGQHGRYYKYKPCTLIH
jgi:hypothetical protein